METPSRLYPYERSSSALILSAIAEQVKSVRNVSARHSGVTDYLPFNNTCNPNENFNAHSSFDFAAVGRQLIDNAAVVLGKN